MNEFLLLILVVIGTVIWLRSRLQSVREDQRAVIFRMGKVFSVAGPASFRVIPFIDKVRVVDLNTSIPEWKSLTAEALEEKVKAIALSSLH